jgi:RNA ligase (TIGR02306 family)
MASALGIVKHEDKPPDTWGTSVSGPSLPGRRGLVGRFAHWAFSDRKQLHIKDPGIIPVYDIEPYKRHKDLIQEGEEVCVTEKLHGTNARFGWVNGKFYTGSRNNFWRDMLGREIPFREKFGAWVWKNVLRRPERTDATPKNLYCHAARQYDLQKKLADVPGLVFYGEIYGQVQDLKYGAGAGQAWLRIFDIYDTNTKKWWSWHNVVCICSVLGLETVPVLYMGPFSEAKLAELVEGRSTLDEGTIREGVVVKPTETRVAERFGRVILKWVSQGYKLRKGGTELQ